MKVLRQESEFYVYVESHDRVSKERAMRRRRLRRLWMGLRELRNRKALTRDDLLMHIGALKKEAGRDYRLVTISIPKPQEPVNENTFRFSLDRERLRQAYRREGALFASFQHAGRRARNRLGKLFAVDADRTGI
ncbi:MAG: hypothetical protein L3J18_00435 [Candidatus Brocadia sp.]|nr:MAG: hypothetical protein L3J18_00435 [Candidatus Brocadia sp.]